MDTHIEIGKAILDNYANYAEIEVIDDRDEYFPTVKVIIKGIVGTISSSKEKDVIQSILVDHVKQNYISLWIKHAKEDEKNPDIEYERKMVIEEFGRLYFYR